MRVLLGAGVFVGLTALSFVGGLAWVAARWAGRRTGRRWLAFVGLYAAMTMGLAVAAPFALPRVPVAASTDAPLQVPRLYRWLNRDFVTPELQGVAQDLARHLDREFPGTVTVALDGGFPFGDGVPLLPHLSHDDGEKLDFALWWEDAEGRYRPGRLKLPLGYWGYAVGPTACPRTWKDLRWDFAWLQPALPDLRLNEARTRAALSWLANDPRVSKILIEPHITARLGLAHPKIRFQGCRAARHDDHIHIQL